jgi:DNA-binding NarL/FixJ family response regulator
MTKKTIIIADDHPVFRLGLSHIINGSEEFAVVAEAENTAELFDVLQSTPCDMVILDMKMEENRDGIKALKKIKETYPEKKVLIMSQLCSPDLVDEAMELGAEGYATKNDIADLILPFLKSIDSGETVLAPRIQSMMISRPGSVVEKLTPREYDILRLSVKGLSRKDIARQLNISISTVNFHRQNIKTKLQADNTAGMIRIAYEEGLV